VQQAIFPGDSELQQLLHIFKLLGTPSEEVWPGVTKLRDWHEFPQWHPQDLHKVFPKLCPAGIDLMQKMFEYDPAKRITVGGCRGLVGEGGWLPGLDLGRAAVGLRLQSTGPRQGPWAHVVSSSSSSGEGHAGTSRHCLFWISGRAA